MSQLRGPDRSAGGRLAALAAIAALAGCGADAERTSPGPTQPQPTASRPAEGRDRQPDLRPPPCPPELAGCERASGRIVYVERVDPDGDGDAHFVLLSAEGVTAPGITIVDVRRDLRPHPLPRPGAELAAAGPVVPGSRKQLQIEAVAVLARP